MNTDHSIPKVTLKKYINTMVSAAAMSTATSAIAQHDLEEIMVTAPLNKKSAETALPVNVIAGEALRAQVADTLGSTLQNQVGLNSSSFGPGVGRPIIRGQSGNRVRVLQNSLGTLDVSSVSPDHGNSAEALVAERIEVVRGPATLLYGNGAIGGVVNVIDNRIPDQPVDAWSGALEQRHNTVSDANTTVFKMEGAMPGEGSQLAWHLDGLYSNSNNIEISGLAIDEEAIEALHGEHEEEEEHEEEIENTDGFIGNSDTQGKALTAGFSWIGDSGFIGFSFGRLENNYGLPAGTHAHHEEEGIEQEHEDEENVRIDMVQNRYALKGEIKLQGPLQSLRGQVVYNDYQHTELEGGNPGTVFSNEGVETRLIADHQAVGPLNGVIGLQLGSSEFRAVGDESFIPATDIRSTAAFVVEGLETENWLYEFGLRVENQTFDPSSRCDRSETTLSGSASALWHFRDDSNLFFALARSERTATVEELFSNVDSESCQAKSDMEQVAHAPTARIEIGDPDMDLETSYNVELGLRKHLGAVRGELNLFYNQIDNYIFLLDSGEEDESGTQISYYRQNNATFSGYEAELSLPLHSSADSHFELSLFSDFVRAKFDSQGDVPRIPPLRYGAQLAYTLPRWSARIRITEVDDQDKIAASEVPTDGYTLVNLYTDYHFAASDRGAVVFIKGNNLLDEEIRNHASFLSNHAPEPGRGFELGIRYQF
ncbi:MAG: TonB-dependent receptor [Exilibacterium sp.]